MSQKKTSSSELPDLLLVFLQRQNVKAKADVFFSCSSDTPFTTSIRLLSNCNQLNQCVICDSYHLSFPRKKSCTDLCKKDFFDVFLCVQKRSRVWKFSFELGRETKDVDVSVVTVIPLSLTLFSKKICLPLIL